ncbi:hypothetical protein AUJ15_02935 [Candidatus Micrarchaeota archaeon CG1_02_55_41]|nr:MAG: hypothetical protein AUJ15_02935 [Candidatus Micrarchaeota archaeon CG1_02_55_41]
MNSWEKILMWQYRRANMRRKTTVTRDFAHSALRYDWITATVFDLEHLGGKRKKRALLNGKFGIRTYNPANVHAQYSDYMLERVCLAETLHAHEVVAFYGEKAKELKKKITKQDGSLDTTIQVTHYDYWDDTYRFVYDEIEGGERLRVKLDDEHGLPFIPWVIASGGTELESDGKYQMEPLLFSDVRAKQWETQNLFSSLMYSLAAFRAAAPTDVSKTLDGKGVDTSYKDAGGQVQLGIGEEYQRLPPPQMDPVIKEMHDRLAAGISKGAGTKVLQLAEIPPGTAFATYNSIVQAGLSAIDNHKQLVERGLADVFGLMLKWSSHTGEALYAWQENRKQSNYGGQLRLEANTIPEDAFIEVRLRPKVPSNRVQEINAASMMVQQLMYPQARALEDLNVEDSGTAFEEWKTEQLNKAAVQAEAQAIIQRTQMDLQLRMQQMAMAQQAQGQVPQQGAPAQQQGMVTQAPYAAMQGATPNQGGISPYGAAPEVMREQITGEARPAQTPEEGE